MSLKRLVLFGIVLTILLVALYQWFSKPSAEDKELVVEGVPFIEIPLEEVAAPPVVAAPVLTPPDLDVDRTAELFSLVPPQLPVVETITYKSRVPWLKGRSAWISDYATHFKTSRHFIARSLSGKPDYFRHEVKDGDRFTVLKSNVNFHLLLDTSRHRLWLYYVDKNSGEKGLIKSYPVSVGRLDPSRTSGSLTPHGIYKLGDRVAVHDETTTGHFQGEKVQMIRIFGTRWIPFQDEISGCTAPAKGYGIHGVPWSEDPITRKLVEDRSSIGQHDSDGCIRLLSADMEELYSIIVSRPTTIEIVNDYYMAVK